MSSFNLAYAIEHGANQGAHVISMSMGGTFNWRLRQAVLYAQRRGVIVLAAGNCVRFVVWPAAYDEVIAVAACNARREIWRGSSRGSKVDVTAPGESVWRASVTGDGNPAGERSSGTSFAVATTAGIAALWLARHGRQALINKYGIEKIPFVFSQMLRDNCDRVPEWEEGKFGAGLPNAEKFLAAKLPETVVSPALEMQEHVTIDSGGISTFVHLFEESLTAATSVRGGAAQASPEAHLRSRLADLLLLSERELPLRLKEIGQELAFHLAIDPELHALFQRSLLSVSLLGKALEGTAPSGMDSVRDRLSQKASDVLKGYF